MKTKLLGIFLSCLLISSNLFYLGSSATNADSFDKTDIFYNQHEKVTKSNSEIDDNDIQLQNNQIDKKIDTNTDKLVNVIVEFNTLPVEIALKNSLQTKTSLSRKSATTDLEKAHLQFKNYISILQKKRNLNYDAQKVVIHNEYRYAFAGVSMQLPGTAVLDILDAKVVARVWSDEVVKLPPIDTEDKQYLTTNSNNAIKVSDVHEREITGKGIKVGVIDTGIDYKHPDLASSYKGFTAKSGIDASKLNPTSIRGWDFVDNDADPMETTYSDWEKTYYPRFDKSGSTYYTSHGTHVSGTIAANPNNLEAEYAALGVAPNVDLYGYRVLGPYGTGYFSNIIAGIDKAVYDDMDIVNMSLGGSGTQASPVSIAVNYATLQGVSVVVSAGNSGPNDFTLGTPGNNSLAITVGASTYETKQEFFDLNVNGTTYNDLSLFIYGYQDADFTAFLDQELSYIEAGLGQESDFKDHDFSGKIAIIKRGEISLTAKAENASKAGAKAIIIYNNNHDDFNVYYGRVHTDIPIFTISKKSGEDLLTQSHQTLIINNLRYQNISGNELASFSSRGPTTVTHEIKPDIIAPGSMIFSTVPAYITKHENSNDYQSAYDMKNGTSMAAPHITGVLALMLEKNPKLTTYERKAALMNNANSLDKDYSVYEVGSGLVDAYDSVFHEIEIYATNTTIHENNKDFKTTFSYLEHFSGSISYAPQIKTQKANQSTERVTIKNNSNMPKEFSTSVNFTNSIDNLASNASLKIPKKIIVKPNKEKTVNAKITVPQTSLVGTYEGYITFTNIHEQHESYRIPFGFKVSNNGINTFFTERPIVGNISNAEFKEIPVIEMNFNSPMKEAYIFVVEQNTDNYLGLISYDKLSGKLGETIYDSDVLYPYETYYSYFLGKVLPVKSVSGVDFKLQSLDEEYLVDGNYDLILKTVDLNDTIHEQRFENIVVHNDSPEMQLFDKNNNVLPKNDTITITDEMYETVTVDGKKREVLTIKGKLYDKQINSILERGFKFDERLIVSMSVLAGDYAAASLDFYTNSDGSFEQRFYREFIETYDVSIRFLPNSFTSYNPLDLQHLGLIDSSSEFATVDFQNQYMEPNIENKMTIRLENVQNFTGASTRIRTWHFPEDLFKITKFSFAPEFKKFAKDNNLKLHKEEIVREKNYTTVSGYILDENFQGFSGDINFIDIYFKTNSKRNDQSFFKEAHSLPVTNISYKQAQNSTVTEIFAYNLNYLDLLTTHKSLNARFISEAFLNEAGNNLVSNDYSKMGIKFYAQEQGADKKYHGTISRYANAKLTLPLLKDNLYDIYYKVPGHLTRVTNTNHSFIHHNRLYGYSKTLNAFSLDNELIIDKAGDVNGDEVIDIIDMHQISKCYLRSDFAPKCDLNQDGVVNETDVRFIEKNFLLQGQLGLEKIPLKTKDGKTLHDYLKELGITPKEKVTE